MLRVLLLFTQAVVAMAHDPLGPGASTTWPLTDPSEIGLSANALADATLAVGDVGTMMCFAIAVNGALVVDETYLESPFTKGRKRAMESMSAAKTVTSIVMGGAMHDGLFTLDKTLASYGVVPHGANWSDNWNGMYVVICSPSLSLSLSLSPPLSLSFFLLVLTIHVLLFLCRDELFPLRYGAPLAVTVRGRRTVHAWNRFDLR